MLDRPTKLKEYQTYIDGKWCDAASGKKFQTFDPYTGEPWALIPECDAKDADRACEAAWRAFDKGPWPAMSQTARGKLLRRIGGLIEQHAQHLAEIEVRDNGKLMSEMHAQTKYLPEWFYYYGGLADKICGSIIPADRPDHFTYTLKEPVGVCAFITPWNSPLMLVGWKLAPALAAGCTVVIKPSEFTTASLLEFMKLVIEPAEVPPGVINVVTGYGAVVGEPLVTHHVPEPLHVLEPHQRHVGGMLGLLDLFATGGLVIRERRLHILAAHPAERIIKPDRVFHRELGARPDREMRGCLGIAENDAIFVDPAVAADGRKIAPHRTVDDQLVALQFLGEQFFHQLRGAGLVHADRGPYFAKVSGSVSKIQVERPGSY